MPQIMISEICYPQKSTKIKTQDGEKYDPKHCFLLAGVFQSTQT